MDDQSRIALVNVAAMRVLLSRLHGFVYALSQHSPDDVKELHREFIDALRDQALVKSDDPFLSDVISDDVFVEIERFLRGVEKHYEDTVTEVMARSRLRRPSARDETAEC